MIIYAHYHLVEYSYNDPINTKQDCAVLVGYRLWNNLLNRYPTAMITTLILLIPVLGMSTSALFLNESLERWKPLAAGLVMTGLILNTLLNRNTAKR